MPSSPFDIKHYSCCNCLENQKTLGRQRCLHKAQDFCAMCKHIKFNRLSLVWHHGILHQSCPPLMCGDQSTAHGQGQDTTVDALCGTLSMWRFVVNDLLKNACELCWHFMSSRRWLHSAQKYGLPHPDSLCDRERALHIPDCFMEGSPRGLSS